MISVVSLAGLGLLAGSVATTGLATIQPDGRGPNLAEWLDRRRSLRVGSAPSVISWIQPAPEGAFWRSVG
jgi:hypothetical protein